MLNLLIAENSAHNGQNSTQYQLEDGDYLTWQDSVAAVKRGAGGGVRTHTPVVLKAGAEKKSMVQAGTNTSECLEGEKSPYGANLDPSSNNSKPDAEVALVSMQQREGAHNKHQLNMKNSNSNGVAADYGPFNIQRAPM